MPAAPHDLSPVLALIGDEQFGRVRSGLAGLPDRDTGVHEARKALKRLRALLRLVRPELRKPRFRDLDRRLRDAGRALAPMRDARVSLDTLDAVAPGRCPTLQERLERRYEQASAGVLVGPIADRMADAHREWAAVLASIEVSAVAGVRRVHRRGCDRYRSVVGRGEAQDFHEWRKQVKHLRYQLEALRTAGRNGLDEAITSLDELGEVLGAEHDFTVLMGLVDAEDQCGFEREVLLEELEARRSALRQQAVPMGDPAFGSAAVGFAAAIEAD
jgi:CHAD domain-containing protein